MPTLAEARLKTPDLLDGLDDEHALEAIHQTYYPDLPKEQVMAAFGIKPPAPVIPSAGPLRTAGDLAIKGAQGVVDLGASVVGLTSLATGGLAGQGMRAIGYDPEGTNKALGEYLSPAQQEADKNVADAKGFVDSLIAMARNPRAIAGQIAESAPAMFGLGGVQGAVAKAIAVRAAARFGGLATEAGAAAAKSAIEDASGRLMWVGAAGEGAQQAGSLADQSQAKGIAYSDYAGPAIASGVADALIARGAGKLMGGDAATNLFTGAAGFKGSRAMRAGKSVFEEGVLQEMPQSAQEQVFQNIAEGKPWNEGVAEQAAAGLMTGGLQGGMMGAASRGHSGPTGMDIIAAEHARADAAVQRIGQATNADDAITAFQDTHVDVITPGPTPLSEAAREENNRRTMASFMAERDLAAQAPTDASLDPATVLGPDATAPPPDAASNGQVTAITPDAAASPPQSSDITSPAAPSPLAGNVASPAMSADGYEAFQPQDGSLGVPRADMPQIKAEHRGAMTQFLAARGISHEQANVPAGSLLPTQAEWSPEKVQAARDYVGGDRAILVSSDDRILDGHHQWLAALPDNAPVRVIRLDAPIATLIEQAHAFPSSTVDTATAAPDIAATPDVATPSPAGEPMGAGQAVAAAPAIEPAPSPQLETVDRATQKMLRKSGIMPASSMEAERAFEGGDRVFVSHDMADGGAVSEATSSEHLKAYTADQMLVLPKGMDRQPAPEPVAPMADRAARMSRRAKAQRSLDPEKDTMLQALAKIGGVDRGQLAQEFGLRPEELRHTVPVGNMKTYPFRVKGGMQMDRAIEALKEAGYFPGVDDAEVRAKFEEEIFNEMAGGAHRTAYGDMYEAQRQSDAAYQDQGMTDAEAGELDDLERMAGVDGLDTNTFTDDDIDLGVESNVSEERFLASMGFTPEEIKHEIARTRAAAQGSPGESGNVAGAQAQAPVPTAGEEARPPLALEAQTEQSLRERADASAARQAADAAEQKRLADKAEADSQRGNFTLTGSEGAADTPGQADLLSTTGENDGTRRSNRNQQGDATDSAPAVSSRTGSDAGNAQDGTVAGPEGGPEAQRNAAQGSDAQAGGQGNAAQRRNDGQKGAGLRDEVSRFAGNKLFTADAAEHAREIIRSKLSVNAGKRGQGGGFDAELMAAGLTLAGAHIEAGARSFVAFSKAMLSDFGNDITPYLKSFYMAVRYDPRLSQMEGISSAAEVDAADVDGIAARHAREAEKAVAPPAAPQPIGPDGVDPAKIRAMVESRRAAAEELPAPPAPTPAEAPGPAIVEHTTQKGKVLRGIVRADLSKADAQKIDPYTFAKDGGFFIREKYLTEEATVPSAAPVGESPALAQARRDLSDAQNGDGPQLQNIRDAQRRIAELERVDAAHEAVAASDRGNVTQLVGKLYDRIVAGGMPKDNPALTKLIADLGHEVTQKQGQEALEAAIVRRTRDLAGRAPIQGIRGTFDRMLELYQSQPNLSSRTSTSIANQAYSTPAPLAFLASRLTHISGGGKVLEPTAGTGMLLMEAKAVDIRANELNPDRAALLEAQGFKVTQMRAENMPSGGREASRVIANPPFGPIQNDAGVSIKTSIDGFKLGQIDHLISAVALGNMKDDGRATLIIGANKVAGEQSNNDVIFFNWLYSHYNVTSHFEVSGDLYTRQGAGWPVRVITINGRQASERYAPAPGTIQRAETWEQVYEHYQEGMEAQRRAAEPRGTPVSDAAPARPTDDRVAVPGPAAGQTQQPDSGKPGGSARGPADVSGQRANVVGNSGVVPVAGVGVSNRPGGSNDETVERDVRARNADGSARPPVELPSDSRGPTLAETTGEFQSTYVPRSSRKDEGVLVPTNMRGPLQAALDRLEDKVGDLDKNVMAELGYASVADVHRAFMGLQVDSIAAAIDQIRDGKGTIIADQTGIGKGRQAAAIIRWSARQGYVPVFVSVKPSLFTDMFGDLHDIGSDDIAPFVLNKDEAIMHEDGSRLFGNDAKTHAKTIDGIATSGELPAGRNAVFMTYSQINVDNRQRKAIEALADRAVFILDESHNAAGDSATGDYIKGVLGIAKGVTYLSATYAKRPDTLPVYFKTDIGQATADDQTLMDAMAAGGLPLQTVVANNLVAAGQMFRRERSYEGVSIATDVDTKNTAKHERMSDEATAGLRAIVEADRMFHATYFKALEKEMAKANAGERAMDGAGNQAQQSVDHTQFTSVVHNFVKQMLLGLKADTAANDAIAAIKAGQKPLIAVDNTMGSFLAEYTANNGIKVGESLGKFDYRTVLSRALERSRAIKVRDKQGNDTRREISMTELARLAPTAFAAYQSAQRTIDNMSIGELPVSPIDWIRKRLTDAGHTVSEITGRSLTVDYSDPKNPALGAMDTQEQKNKVETTRRFNDGRLDAIILNVSGSTGISLHASEKFKDQRPRKMIVAQAAGDINVFMQMLGRIHRTGQVVLPSYSLLSADLPAEKRPTAVLSGKMKSLNANTSSNTDSATSVKALDILNKYGDQVVANYLHENGELANVLGLPVDDPTKDVEDDLARKTTGRVALLPVQQQRDFYTEVEGQYASLIEYLNKTGQNELEPRTIDFGAKVTREERIFEGQNPATPFGQDATYGEYSVKAQGKPMTVAEVKAAVAEHLGDKSPAQHAGAIISRLEKDYPAFADQANQRGVAVTRDPGRGFIATHNIGTMFRVDINGDSFNAVVTNLRSTHKALGNPFAMSKIQVTLALNGSLRSVTVPASQFGTIEVNQYGQMGNQYGPYKVDQLMASQALNERETAKIVTGNLLGAYGELSQGGGRAGSIISFTKADGTVEQGILLPKSFNFAKDIAQDYRLKTAADAVAYLTGSQHENIERFGIMSRDNVVRVLPSGLGGVTIQVPKSKAKGGKFFLDKNLLAVTGDFASSGNYMRASVTGTEQAVKAVQILMDRQALYAVPSMANDAREVLNDPKDEPPKVNPGRAATAEEVANPDAAQGATGNVPTTLPALRTAKGAAQWLAANARDPGQRELAAQLAKGLEDTPVGYVSPKDSGGAPAEVIDYFKANPDVGGVSITDSYGQNTIWLRQTADGVIDQDLLLHELLHGATADGLTHPNGGALRAELDSIREVVRGQLGALANAASATEDARSSAGFFLSVIDNNDEMLAYGLTSPTFRTWSQSMDANGRWMAPNEKGPTLWQRFVDLVRSAIGMSKLYSGRIEKLMSRTDGAFQTTETPRNLADKLDQLLAKTMEMQASPRPFDMRAPRSKNLPGIAEMATTVRGMKQDDYRNLFVDAVKGHGKLGLFNPLNTQYAKAEANPTTFKPVFEAVQDFISGTSVFANAAADLAPGILPKLDSRADLFKRGTAQADLKSAGNAAFQGTLSYTRDDMGRLVRASDAQERADMLDSEQKAGYLFRAGKITEAQLKAWQANPLDIYDGAVRNAYEREFLRPGVVFKDDELKRLFSMSPKQIGLYREFRAAVDQSLDDLARTELVRLAGNVATPDITRQMMAAPDMAGASQILSDHVSNLQAAATDQATKDSMFDLFNKVADKTGQIQRLKEKGYAPLMRYGRHTVHVTQDGKTAFFGMYESNLEANRMARELRNQPEFAQSSIKQGLMSEEAWKLYQGMPMDALELFAETTGNADNKVYQDFLRLTKSNRSVMKRLIERKGIAGFNEDTARVLATFVTSNARSASGNVNLGRAAQAIEAIPKEMGDIKDEAVKLVQYVQNPSAEAGWVRGLLFTNFIGGSVASAMVNLTQPLTMTMPYLSQFGGGRKAFGHMNSALSALARGNLEPAVQKAMDLAEARGIVSPQEIHHLQAESGGSSLGRNPYLRKAAFIWSSMFSLSEQFNRRVTFVAAYNTAREQNMADPQAFAEKAVIETQGLYNKGNKPNAARGAIGATVMCVDETTEALTARGWLKIDEVVPGDLFASFDMKTERLVWKPAADIYRSEHGERDMVHIHSQGLDMLTTPDHRCVTYRRRRAPGGRSENATFDSLEIQEAQNLSSRDVIPSAAEFDHVPLGEPVRDAIVPVLGWVTTEGCYYPEGYVCIYQNENKFADAIRADLRAAGIDWTETSHQYEMGNGLHTRFFINATRAKEIRGLMPDKHLRPELLMRLSVEQIRVLVNKMIDGDGSVQRRVESGYADQRVFIQNPGPTLESFQMALTMLGISFSVRDHGEACKKVILRGNSRHHVGRATKEFVEYSGRVWCPMIPDTNTWVARRNGMPFITHNTFKQFSIHYLEFLSRMAKSGPEGRKAVGVAMAMLVLAAGGGGLPFADDLDDLIDTLAQALGYDFSSKRAKRAFIAETLGLGQTGADVALRGVSGIAGMPIDVSMRMGMGNLIPMTGILLRSNNDRSRDVLEIAGAAGGLAKNALDAGGQLLRGNVANAGMTMAPLAIQNMAKAAQMWNTGEYRNSADKKVMDVDGLDAAMKAIGFQPAGVARQSAALADVTRSKQLATNVQREIVSQWAQGLNDNEPDKVANARALLREWNDNNETSMKMSMQSIIGLVRTMRQTPQQRLLRSAPASARADYAERLAQ